MNILSFAKKTLSVDTTGPVHSLMALGAITVCFAGQALAGDASPRLDVLPLLFSSLIFLAVMALVFGIALALTAKKFFVKTDPRVDEINEALAHAHCGACGFGEQRTMRHYSWMRKTLQRVRVV